ncbi:MAG: type II toxin-antitoxin system RelE/ParE family toxin [Lentisphaerae bacterium]|nr:type II toxin-antitoxin system RelE/ParE family toxin [Lentisphaerota bacterium]
MLDILISDQARADLADIWAYIAEDNIPAADRLNLKIMNLIRRLAEFPEIGRERPEITVVAGLRSLPVDNNYLVFYQATEDALRIHRVLHGSMDIPSLFDIVQ